MPRQEKNASEKRKQVEKGGSHPCMRASVCVNVARTPYRGLLLSPPFFLPFFSLLYLLCAPLYAPLLALRSRTCSQTAACLFNASSFPSSSSSLRFSPFASHLRSPKYVSFLRCFLEHGPSFPFSLHVSFRVVSYGFCNQHFFPHFSSPRVCSLLFFSSSRSSPLLLLLLLLLLLRLFLFVPVISSSSCPSIPTPHAPGGKMTRTNRCCNFVITTVCSSTLLTKNRYRERSLRASRAQPAAEKFFGYNPSAWRT